MSEPLLIGIGLLVCILFITAYLAMWNALYYGRRY